MHELIDWSHNRFIWLNDCSSLIGLVVDWLITNQAKQWYWLVDWWTRFIDWLINRLIGVGLTDWLIICLIHWSTDWLHAYQHSHQAKVAQIDWSIDWSIRWLVDWSIDQKIWCAVAFEDFVDLPIIISSSISKTNSMWLIDRLIIEHYWLIDFRVKLNTDWLIGWFDIVSKW